MPFTADGELDLRPAWTKRSSRPERLAVEGGADLPLGGRHRIAASDHLLDGLDGRVAVGEFALEPAGEAAVLDVARCGAEHPLHALVVNLARSGEPAVQGGQPVVEQRPEEALGGERL